jgi:hypothetical protein
MNKMRAFIFLLFLLSADTIFGCMCGHSSISDSYAAVDAVVVAKVIGFKPKTVYQDMIIYEGDDDEVGRKVQDKLRGQEVKIEVSRWFKGENQRPLIYLSQPSSTCDKEFRNADLNENYLFYLHFDKKYKTYKIRTCGRSDSVENAADDISWLNGLPESLNRTRLSGTVRFKDDENIFPHIAGVKIKITGNGKEYELVSDKNGMYEIWDVPAGDYRITADMPDDKKINWTISVPDSFTDYWFEGKPDPDGSKVKLAPKSTGGIDFMLQNK